MDGGMFVLMIHWVFFINSSTCMELMLTLRKTTVDLYKLEKQYNESDNKEAIVKRILDFYREERAEKLLIEAENKQIKYVVHCGKVYRNAIWMMEKLFMNHYFIDSRPEVQNLRDEMAKRIADSQYHSVKSNLYGLFMSLPEKKKKACRNALQYQIISLFHRNRLLMWSLFLTWLTQTEQWKGDKFTARLIPFYIELNKTLEKGLTIDDFRKCILCHFSFATMILKNPNHTQNYNYSNEAKILEQIKLTYKKIIEMRTDESKISFNRTFVAHYCGELLHETMNINVVFSQAERNDLHHFNHESGSDEDDITVEQQLSKIARDVLVRFADSVSVTNAPFTYNCRWIFNISATYYPSSYFVRGF